MNYHLLGRTGLYVSELCLGTMTFGRKSGIATTGTSLDLSAIGELTQQEATQLVDQALVAGVNFFDTAEVYANGESEIMLGKALGARRKDVIIATKVIGRTGPKPDNTRALTRRHILEAVEASLTRLGTDYIDLYQTHTPDPLTPVDETLRALEDMVRAGKVRYIGCSNLMAWQVMKALGVSQRLGLPRFESVQAYYSLASRELEREMAPLLLDQQVSLLVYSPLAGGLLTDKFALGKGPATSRRAAYAPPIVPAVDMERALRCIALLQQIAPAHQVSVAQIALAWLLHQKPVTSVLLGAKDPRQLSDNLKAREIQLSAQELQSLADVSILPL
jgi:aryl-alcohol dehydrogenase-like predicted oxidoreductase